jgi:hypothetical protein
VLDEVIARRGRPVAIRCDNGPELTSRHFLAWSVDWHIEVSTFSWVSQPRTHMWKASRRAPAGDLVYQPLRRSQKDRRLEKGVQRGTTTQQSRLQNASRVCTAKQEPELWKTWASPTWKTSLTFPTLPQLWLRVKFVRSNVPNLGAGEHLSEVESEQKKVALRGLRGTLHRLHSLELYRQYRNQCYVCRRPGQPDQRIDRRVIAPTKKDTGT